MNNLLMKLKKDGKTVGYLKIEDGTVWFREAGEYEVWDLYKDCCQERYTDFQKAHPYVTDDKNGDKVFYEDKVTVYFGELPSTLTAKAKIFYSHCQYMAGGIEEDNNKGPWSLDSKRIELIKEKDNG